MHNMTQKGVWAATRCVWAVLETSSSDKWAVVEKEEAGNLVSFCP
jgi:hypothetical protein